MNDFLPLTAVFGTVASRSERMEFGPLRLHRNIRSTLDLLL